MRCTFQYLNNINLLELQSAKPTAILWDKSVLFNKERGAEYFYLNLAEFSVVTSQGSGFLQTLTKQHYVGF